MRITLEDLRQQISRLNEIKGTPQLSYINVGDKLKPQQNCYHLSQAYGGVALHQMSSVKGCTGVRDIFGGHMSKKELYNRLAGHITLLNND